MCEEPTLPRLPAVARDENTDIPSTNIRKRVRQSHLGSLQNSSDPAIFSSDDDPGLDNYVEGRKKKRYVGSWFRQQLASSDSPFGDDHGPHKGRSQRNVRKLTRQFDSGICLGSDGSDDLSSEISEMLVQPKTRQLGRRPQLPLQTRAADAAEALARRKIQECVDQGKETVDLWSLGLERISSTTIQPLAGLTCIPTVTKDVAFEQKDPELKIYLAMNELRSLPGALFDLEYLTVLSLRGNKITELPPAVAKLPNLTQLNVSQNRLRCLPAELMDLFGHSLQGVILHPNPFFQPETRDKAPESSGAGHVGEGLVAQYHGRSRVQVCDSQGRVVSTFRLPVHDDSNKVQVSAAEAEEERRCRPSRVPSMVELCMQRCYATAELGQLPQYMPDGLPLLSALLERALRQKEMGGLCCTGCRKMVVVPRLEWIEWYEVGTREAYRDGSTFTRPLSLADDEKLIPFRRRGCSWKCGPSASS